VDLVGRNGAPRLENKNIQYDNYNPSEFSKLSVSVLIIPSFSSVVVIIFQNLLKIAR